MSRVRYKVRTDQYNLIFEKSVQLKECPKCSGGGGKIVIDLQWYSKPGVSARCPRCGFETKKFGCTWMMTDGRRYGSVCIPASLGRGILRAARAWNREKRVAVPEYDIDDDDS